MTKLSVVIITKNEEFILPQTLVAAKAITDDVLVYDTGSTDHTIATALANGARVIEGSWQGFGPTKNEANTYANHDWILQLDADEIPDAELQNSLKQLLLGNEKELYSIQFKNFLGDRWMRYGEWGTDKHIRLFNRTCVKWNAAAVHEELIYDETFTVKKIQGFILHKTMQSAAQYLKKINLYAVQGGEKYFLQGKKGGWWKQFVSPVVGFLKNYILKFGFLDGKAGLTVAKISAKYTYLKYATLNQLNKKNKDTR